MIKLSAQKGFAPVIVVVILLLGLASTAYLVSQRTQLKSKASADSIQIVDESGSPITTSKSNQVKVRLNSLYPPKIYVDDNTIAPSNEVRPDKPGDSLATIKGRLYGKNYPSQVLNFGNNQDSVPVRLILEGYKKGVSKPIAKFTTNYFTVTR